MADANRIRYIKGYLDHGFVESGGSVTPSTVTIFVRRDGAAPLEVASVPVTGAPDKKGIFVNLKDFTFSEDDIIAFDPNRPEAPVYDDSPASVTADTSEGVPVVVDPATVATTTP